MGLAARARRLVAARRIGEDRPTGLVWASPAPDLVPADPESGRVVLDYTVVVYRAGDVCEAVWRERLARAEDDHGDVYAWDGSLIGAVRPGASGGVLLPFRWPEGLAFVRPSFPRGRAPGGVDDLAAIREGRAADQARIAGELAGVERSRRG